MHEKNWLVWARETKGIAPSGLIFTTDPRDRALAQVHRMFAHYANPALHPEFE